MQLAFQKKISEDLAAQSNRSKLEKGLKKMKLLLETTKTVNAEQGKHAFEVQVKRLELAQEQARADARADARWLNGGCTKRQRSRSVRFHFALFLFCLTTSGTNKHLNHISRSPRQNKRMEQARADAPAHEPGPEPASAKTVPPGPRNWNRKQVKQWLRDLQVEEDHVQSLTNEASGCLRCGAFLLTVNPYNLYYSNE